MGLIFVWIITLVIVFSATIPTSTLMSYVNNKPLGMQTLLDLSIQDLLILEFVYIYEFLFNLTIALIFGGLINRTFVLITICLLYTSLYSLLVHVGLHTIVIFVLRNCNHLLDNVQDFSVMAMLRTINLFLTSFLAALDLISGHFSNEKLYFLMLGLQGQPNFKPYSLMFLGLVDLTIYLIIQIKMEILHKQSQNQVVTDESTPVSIWARFKNLFQTSCQQSPEPEVDNVIDNNEEYSIVTLRVISCVVGIGFAIIVSLLSLAILSPDQGPGALAIHMFAIFFMMFVNNSLWIIKSPKIFDYAKLQLNRMKL